MEEEKPKEPPKLVPVVEMVLDRHANRYRKKIVWVPAEQAPKKEEK